MVPRRSNFCMKKNQAPVVKHMCSCIDRWEKQADQRAIFLRCYLLMTRNMLSALRGKEFKDRVWVGKLLRHFADYYFRALKAYNRNPRTAPRVWRVAHDTARNPKALVFHHLLLGVNAHINYDLVLVLNDLLLPGWDSLPEDRRQERRRDFDEVNKVIGRTIDVVQNQIVDRSIPAMRIVDELMGPTDEWMVSHLIAHWRDEVWQNAIHLIETPSQRRRAALVRQVEASTLKRSQAILLKDGWGTLRDLL